MYLQRWVSNHHFCAKVVQYRQDVVTGCVSIANELVHHQYCGDSSVMPASTVVDRLHPIHVILEQIHR